MSAGVKVRVLLLALIWQWDSVFAQDPHFSQYFASPLTLNPVNTGYFDGDYRIATNFRQQWLNVGEPFTTATVSYDVKILKWRIPENDRLGLGIAGMFDESLGGALRSTYVSLSGAYHKALAHDGMHNVGVGFQLTFANRTVDYSRLSFASQFNGLGFDTSLPSNVTVANKYIAHLDMSTGVLYSLHLKRINAYAGASLYHISQPQEALFNEVETRLNHRYTVHAAAEHMLNGLTSVSFSGVYMKQGNIAESLFGGGYKMQSAAGKNSTGIFLGVWHRVKDAIIPYVGIEYRNVQVGVNYEISTTNTYYNGSSYALKPQTVEVSMIFRKKPVTDPAGICPRF